METQQLYYHFFEEIKSRRISSPASITKEFAKFFLDKELNINNTKHTISVAANNTSLSFLTKRLSLLSDNVIITHKSDNSIFIALGETNDREDYWSRISLVCPNEIYLGKWLLNCENLLLQGAISYYPKYRYTGCSWLSNRWDYTKSSISVDAIVSSRDIVEIENKNLVKSKLIRPIIRIEIPYIDNVDIKTFSKITLDEKSYIEPFRNHLKLNLLSIKDHEHGEFFDVELEKLGIEIRDGVRMLDDDLKALRRKRSFEVTGAVIAMTTATLIAVHGTAFETVSKVLGSGGGIFLLSRIIAENDFKKTALENSPYYYLWLFSK